MDGFGIEGEGDEGIDSGSLWDDLKCPSLGISH